MADDADEIADVITVDERAIQSHADDKAGDNSERFISSGCGRWLLFNQNFQKQLFNGTSTF